MSLSNCISSTLLFLNCEILDQSAGVLCLLLPACHLGQGPSFVFFGPEYMGGVGDVGAKFDAEVARTGLSAVEIGPKVHISYQASRRTKRICIQRYYIMQTGNSLGFLGFL